MNLRKYINLFEDQTIDDQWFKQGSFKTYKKPNPEKYEIAQQDGTIQTLEGPVNYKKGYYILTGTKGETYPMPPEKFHELKDDAGDGVCYPKKNYQTGQTCRSQRVGTNQLGRSIKLYNRRRLHCKTWFK